MLCSCRTHLEEINFKQPEGTGDNIQYVVELAWSASNLEHFEDEVQQIYIVLRQERIWAQLTTSNVFENVHDQRKCSWG